MADAQREMIVAATRRIDESRVTDAGARRNLEGARIIDTGLDGCVIEEGSEVAAKTTAPFGLSGFGIVRLGAFDHRRIEGHVELLRCALHDQNVVAVLADVL